MPISFIFWTIMLLWLVFGLWSNRPKEPGFGGYGPIGGSVLLFILLALLRAGGSRLRREGMAFAVAISETAYVGTVNTIIAGMVAVAGLYFTFKTKAIEKQNATIDAKVTDTLKWVNSLFGVQLRRTAVADRRLAFVTKNPADELTADESERLYAEHMAKGRAIDLVAAAGRGDDNATKAAVEDVRKEAIEAVADKLKEGSGP